MGCTLEIYFKNCLFKEQISFSPPFFYIYITLTLYIYIYMCSHGYWGPFPPVYFFWFSVCGHFFLLKKQSNTPTSHICVLVHAYTQVTMQKLGNLKFLNVVRILVRSFLSRAFYEITLYITKGTFQRKRWESGKNDIDFN